MGRKEGRVVFSAISAAFLRLLGALRICFWGLDQNLKTPGTQRKAAEIAEKTICGGAAKWELR